LTEDGSPKSIAQALQALSQIRAELKLVIAGNHEISMDEAFYLAEGGNEADVEEAYALVGPEAESEASKCGVTFLLEGTHHFTLFSGATFSIYASPYTPKNRGFRPSNTRLPKIASICKIRHQRGRRTLVSNARSFPTISTSS
jgi:hypothetical protein